MPSPKQPQSGRQRDWYPYYAGFTERFVAEVLTAHVGDNATVVDPWNGSGTTTATCAKRGFSSFGVDTNPVLTVIARARLTPRSVTDSLLPLGREILDAADRDLAGPVEDDLLEAWMHRKAARRLRTVQRSIHSILSDAPVGLLGAEGVELADRLPVLACFYYSALFAATRDLLSRFRASNPTWVRLPENSKHRISPSSTTMSAHFLRRVSFLSDRLCWGEDAAPDQPGADIRTGSATDLPIASATYDACVTSPPYATRIDYVKNTLPELAVLGATATEVEDLRRTSTGSPVISGVAKDTSALRSHHACSVLRHIEGHPSKGSSRYYLPWMSNYFRGLQRGLLELDRVVILGGPICLVVQDSYYKEHHVDLQRIVVETMDSLDRQVVHRRDYEAVHHRARMNPRARRYVPNRRGCESLLVFR